MIMASNVSAYPDDSELELGLGPTLGCGGKAMTGQSSVKYARILTAKDFPSHVSSVASSSSSLSSPSSCSSPSLSQSKANVSAGTKISAHSQSRAKHNVVKYWPWIVALAIPFLFAGLSLINKKALNEGMDFQIFCTYRNALAFLVLIPFVAHFERNLWPQATWMTFLHMVGLALFEPVLDQNLIYAGLNKISVSLAASFGLLQPVITFTLACIFRYERVYIATRPSQAKVTGALVAFIGAVIVAASPGNFVIRLPWTKESYLDGHNGENTIAGIAFCLMAMLSAGSYSVLLTRTLADFAAPFTITASTSLLGALINFVVAQVFGSGVGARWMITLDASLLAYAYSGVMISAGATYIVSVVTRVRGPVFVASFSPLSMVIVTVVGTVLLGEQLYLVRIIAVCCIVLGMSLLLWGKAKENQTQPQQQPSQPSSEGV